MRSFLGVSFVCLGLIACGGDGLDISTNASNVCSEIAKVACHNLYQCCSEGEIEDFLGVDEPRTKPQCQEDVRRLCDRAIARLDEAIEAKRVRFDSAIMNGCLEALVAPSGTCASVESVLPWAEDCMNSAWVGLVTDGGQCFGTFECASVDSFCAPNQTCTARPTTGQPCTGTCATGNFCQLGTCQPQGGAGAPCTSTVQCLNPLFCDFATGTCTEVRDGGESCTTSAACKSGQCIPGTCAGSTTPCSSSGSCGRRCMNNGNPCGADSGCGPGQCNGASMAMCGTGFPACPVTETCVFQPLCQPVDCVGQVCSTAQIVVDYCEDALGDIPFPVTN